MAFVSHYSFPLMEFVPVYEKCRYYKQGILFVHYGFGMARVRLKAQMPWHMLSYKRYGGPVLERCRKDNLGLFMALPDGLETGAFCSLSAAVCSEEIHKYGVLDYLKHHGLYPIANSALKWGVPRIMG